MWIATLLSASRIRRAPITRLVTLSPSVPASGLSLIEKVIASVGGSIGWACSGVSTSIAQIVSATVVVVMPARATISPASASLAGMRSMPRKARILVMRKVSMTAPSRDSDLTAWLAFTMPE